MQKKQSTNTDLLGYLNTTSLRLSSKKLGMVLRKLGVHPVKIRRNGQPVQAYPLMQTGRSS